MNFLVIILSGTFFGVLLSMVWNFFERRLAFQKAKAESNQILQEAQEKSETLLDNAKSEFDKIKQKIFQSFDNERECYKKRIQEAQSKIDKKAHKLILLSKEQEKSKKSIKHEISVLKNKRQGSLKQLEKIGEEFKAKESQLLKNLTSHFSINVTEIKTSLKKSIEESWVKEVTEQAEKYEKQQAQDLQKTALFNLNLALNRFERVHCRIRTIEPVQFRNLKLLEKIVGKDEMNIKQLEKECGVDMLVNKEDLLVQIFGIDPVRRELGRVTLKSLLKHNRITSDFITEQVKKCKRELFRVITRDGKNICRNLRLRDVHPEIQNMMGALKYRYSFAQNQYYHCEEVGWLCGLLSSELSLPTVKGKRAGMFHDIGKAMDHSIEGSHAVIGADFLAKRSEADDVTHAVRAHHHDETPSTALAYLVISADAISGSRPGARRFTEDSYSKKLASLERIIDSFDNIEDAYIMSAGREMRVIVNNKKINDRETLDLSKKIARQIEKECSYPGLIKVTVVRHSEALSISK